MFRIGILTFHRSVNNGAVMQAYSLSRRLQKEYPEAKVEIIDFHMAKVVKSYQYDLRSYLKSSNAYTLLRKLVKLALNPKMLTRMQLRTATFEKAIHQLPLSEFQLISDEADELYNYINSTYDALVVGSDAVWNYVMRGFPNIYLPTRSVTCPKLSYAASCYGMDYTVFSKNHVAQIKDALDDFTFAGVRDTATEDFVRWSGSSTTPVHTCDPTAFLNTDELPIDVEALKKKLRERNFDFERPTIGMMGTPSMCRMIRQLYGKQYQIAALYEYVPDADVNLYDLTPYEWAYVFRYFKVTFTTYFHGTMLSLRNGVPVICIALQTEFAKKHTPKTLDVLRRLGFDDWYFTTDYQGENFSGIKEKADTLLTSSLKQEITSRMDAEAASFNNFKLALDNIINNQ